ncbi:Astacin domain containing protein [Trichuris trichiura]|uniref:Metalloendopeptidase n=1 Tax=Trichuris trichiura TaxID=36087 RepID=A0A077Z8F3_TRITR|nr:Astacin domain containing protein [Trichuris trichiura]
MKLLLVLYFLCTISQRCVAETNDPNEVKEAENNPPTISDNVTVQSVMREEMLATVSVARRQVTSMEVNETSKSENLRNENPLPKGEEGNVSQTTLEKEKLVNNTVEAVKVEENKEATTNKRSVDTTGNIATTGQDKTVIEEANDPQIPAMTITKEEDIRQPIRRDVNRQRNVESSSSEETSPESDVNHGHGHHHGHNESSSSSSSEEEHGHHPNCTGKPPPPPEVHNVTNPDNIWDELKTVFGFSDEHVDKYKAFMDKVRQYRWSKLDEKEREKIVDYRNINMGGAEGNPLLYEGDILLSENQIDILNKVIDEDINGTKRVDLAAIASNLASRWTTTIYYTISGVDSNVIEAGLQKWRDTTCLKFIRNDQYTGDRIQYIKGSGCYSSVGRLGGKQQVSIGAGCERVGTVCHETSHALGVWHEQSRTDRDNYISVNYNNIMSAAVGNFERLTSNIMYLDQVPYDFGSEMHYPSKAFAVNYNQYTIQTKDSKYQWTIGQRDYPSFNDAKVLNLAYCGSVCMNINCQNKGYADPKNCNVCRCPEGLAGNRCEKSKTTSSNCGQTDYTVGTSPVTFTKSGSGTCYYLIKAA